MAQQSEQHVEVAIVGAGFGGLGMAIRLKQSGESDFVVLERQDGVGGVWRANTYPGAACDVPSLVYSYAFAPNPGWSHSFSRQPEILGYLERCADDFGVRPHIRLSTQVLDATWDEGTGRWNLRTTRGDLTAKVLVAAQGGLSDPKAPDIPGLDGFAGEICHSAKWDHDVDFAGKDVAVIGTGASAIQLVPKIVADTSRLDVYQRTPPWIIPRADRRLTRVEKRLYRRFPALQRLARAAVYWGRETYVMGFVHRPAIMRIPQRLAERHLERQVPDAVLREKLRPDYRIGCKRILISNDWYPALSRDDADVVTTPIAEVRARSIVDRDGVERPADVIVFATGFEVTPPPVATRVHGRDGRTLAEHWREKGMTALRGSTVAGFPNLFLIVGPNTGLGHNSIVHIVESQIAYVLDALRTIRARGVKAVDPKPEAQERWNADVQRRMEGSIWSTGGCASWYLDEHGNNVTLWPGACGTLRRETKRFDPAEYELVA